MCDTERNLDIHLGIFEPYGEDVRYSSDEDSFDDYDGEE